MLFVICSNTPHKMSSQITEVASNQRLSPNGGRVYKESRKAQTTRREAGGEFDVLLRISSFKVKPT